MKKVLSILLLVSAATAVSAPLTLKTLSVDKRKQSVCGIQLGMAKAQVKAELEKRKLDHAFGQRLDPHSRKMKIDENTIEIKSEDKKIVITVDFSGDKVSYMEIVLEGYKKEETEKFAKKFWKSDKKTKVEVSDDTIMISQK